MRSLYIESDTATGGHVVLRLKGRFSVEDSIALRDILDQYIAEGRKAIFMDCTELSQINSAAIGVLVGAKMKMNRYAGMVLLFGLNNLIQEVMKLTGVDLILPSYQNLEEAIQSFEKG